MGPDSANGRVTLAVLQAEIRHLGDRLDRHVAQLCGDIGSLKDDHRQEFRDHEERLRTLEGATRQGLWRDIGTFFTALGAGIAAWLTSRGP